MAEENDPLEVNQVFEAPNIRGRDESADQQGRRNRRHQRHENHPAREAKDYFRTIDQAARRSNDLLRRRNAPFRFSVYEKEGEVFIELVRRDTTGKTVQVTRNRITHKDFEHVIEDVSQIEGLFFDSVG